MGYLLIGLLVAAVGLGLIGSSRWAADKGWVYNKHNPRSGGTGYPMLMDQVFNPAVRHVEEQRETERIVAEEDESAGA